MEFGERKTILVGTLVIMVMVAALWFGFRSRTLVAIQEHHGELRPGMSPHASPAGASMLPVVAASAITTPMTEAERQKAINQLESTPIVFFGRVVDQHDLPVAGARAAYTSITSTSTGMRRSKDR